MTVGKTGQVGQDLCDGGAGAYVSEQGRAGQSRQERVMVGRAEAGETGTHDGAGQGKQECVKVNQGGA